MSPSSAEAAGGGDDSRDSSPTPETAGPAPAEATPNSNIPKPKRLACMICRKRKLKCDGLRPSCSTCTRLGHSCAYDEVRKKSGPKRGYVKALEERLKQVEKLLKTQDPAMTVNTETNKSPTAPFEPAANQISAASANFNVTNPSIAIAGDRDMDRWRFNGESPQTGNVDDFSFNNSMPIGMGNMDNSFTWEMVGLGLEEPLPPQDTIDELHQIFFEKVHPSLPMIHKFRYLAAMNLAPNQRPPVALRYAIWTLACSVTDKYTGLRELFYHRARKYVEADYIKGFGEHMITVAHAQTHVMLASYEFRMMYFPRAWMNTGSAVRLCQMMGLHRQDGNGLEVKQCLPPPRDWTEREERRRTFWMAFCQDRYASIGTGWPMTIDERDIMTNLPASEDAFEMSRPEQTQSLGDSMSPSGAAKLSSFGGIVLMACLFGRNLVHLHRPDTDDRDHDLNGEFWKRHRNMDNILLNTSLCLPNHLKLPTGLNNSNIVFTNMNIHTSTICLHQAAIFKADKNRLPASVSSESKVRCITAANEIASIMRMVSHMDLSTMNPFISFCLYVAARVFVQYLKSRPDDSQTADSLRFLLAAMSALKRKNPLTESFLVQLDVDLEALGMRIPKLKSAFQRSGDSPSNSNMPSHGPKNNVEACDVTDRGGGIMAYRNECVFSKVSGDDGNPVTGPDIVEPQDQTGGQNGVTPTRQGPSEYGNQHWMQPDHRLPTRERSSGPDPSMILPHFQAGGYVDSSSSGGTNDLSASPNADGQSSRPTPNSSTNSDHRQSTGGTRSRTSFDASPLGMNQNLGTQAELEGNSAAYFSPSGFHTGMTPGRAFAVPEASGNGYGNGVWQVQGQTGMTPVDQGVMQHLMPMPQMDSMDLSWESGA